MTKREELDLVMGLYGHVIDKCDRHLESYKTQTSNLIMKISEVGFKE